LPGVNSSKLHASAGKEQQLLCRVGEEVVTMVKDHSLCGAGFLAACRRFPQHEFTIRRLMKADPEFRDICDELADAEAALERVDESSPAHLRETRRLEWSELVERLVREVFAGLHEHR
jgi:hypothetical protein